MNRNVLNHLSSGSRNRSTQPEQDCATELDAQESDFEEDCIRVCRHFPECPYTPPPGDEDCPGCRANEQYSDEGPGLILSTYKQLRPF